MKRAFSLSDLPGWSTVPGLLISLSLLALGCGPEPEALDMEQTPHALASPLGPQLGQAGQSSLPPAMANLRYLGVVRVQGNHRYNPTNCSGTMLTNTWLLTTRRCVTLPNGDAMIPGQVWVRQGARFSRAAAVIPSNMLDLALVRLPKPMYINNKLSGMQRVFHVAPHKPWAPKAPACATNWRGFWADKLTYASGQPQNPWDPTTTTQARSFGSEAEQISGGACFYQHPDQGLQLLGIYRKGYNPFTRTYSTPLLSVDLYRSWVAQVLNEHELMFRHSLKCLTVPNWSTSVGTAIQQRSCYRGRNQRFRLVPEQGGKLRIMSVISGKCLGLRPGGSGALLEQQWCRDIDRQRFSTERADIWAGGSMHRTFFIFKSAASGNCIDQAGAGRAEGGAVQQYGCHKGYAQQLGIGTLPGTHTLKFRNIRSDRCMQLQDKKWDSEVDLVKCRSLPHQRFKMQQYDHDTYHLRNVYSGWFLDTKSRTAGNNLRQSFYHVYASRRFKLQYWPGKGYRLVAFAYFASKPWYTSNERCQQAEQKWHYVDGDPVKSEICYGEEREFWQLEM